ncbi:MAG: sigma-70 family RNA polymerase sigma factor [Chloroflexota bacterium]
MQVTKLFKPKKNNATDLTDQATPELEFSADSAPEPETTKPRLEDVTEIAKHEKVIIAAQQGDLDAFNELVKYYEQRVYNLSYRLLADREAAADATQDAFLQAYRCLHQYRGGSFKSWLLRIASNLCYDQLRSKARRPSSSLEAMLDEAEETGGAALAWMEDNSADPQDQALRHELLREVSRALQTLSYEQRLVVILSDVQGLSYEEIVEVTNVSLGTVKSRLNRGRVKMRELLQKNSGTFSH